MDVIKIENLEIYAYHGVFEEEKKKGQKFYINAKLFSDLKKAGKNDTLSDSTHYGEVCLQMERSMTESTFDLIERAAWKTAEDVLLQFPLVKSITLELKKPYAPIPMKFESVSVEITRGWHRVYIAFGSNMGKKEKYIQEGIEEIKKHRLFRNVKVSQYFYSTPYGGVSQDDFVNGVLEAETMMEPQELLEYLHDVEQNANRVRVQHWGPRTLDLDILLFDDEIIDEPNLQIPHRDMKNRDFVLVPLAQLAGYKRHPVYHITIDEMLQNIREFHIIN
ncbi:MAG: 2-amino-4-hydroxy-6-hydroxymethyldihydropteridine diphosphokinase [Lachnospiraceae bacterium]|nr:2-amino-4-hydroxy-6-hydroxymethyldihydropteridine diphosphokinase [Lachnospiraceae bacterium]